MTEQENVGVWIGKIERWYMAVRMAAMNPDYLASHQAFSDADNARVVDVILDYKQCEHGNARGYCAECGKANKITCHRCNGERELYEAGEEPVSCPVCDGEAEIVEEGNHLLAINKLCDPGFLAGINGREVCQCGHTKNQHGNSGACIALERDMVCGCAGYYNPRFINAG